jgi:hypothetical protein
VILLTFNIGWIMIEKIIEEYTIQIRQCDDIINDKNAKNDQKMGAEIQKVLMSEFIFKLRETKNNIIRSI